MSEDETGNLRRSKRDKARAGISFDVSNDGELEASYERQHSLTASVSTDLEVEAEAWGGAEAQRGMERVRKLEQKRHTEGRVSRSVEESIRAEAGAQEELNQQAVEQTKAEAAKRIAAARQAETTRKAEAEQRAEAAAHARVEQQARIEADRRAEAEQQANAAATRQHVITDQREIQQTQINERVQKIELNQELVNERGQLVLDIGLDLTDSRKKASIDSANALDQAIDHLKRTLKNKVPGGLNIILRVTSFRGAGGHESMIAGPEYFTPKQLKRYVADSRNYVSGQTLWTGTLQQIAEAQSRQPSAAVILMGDTVEFQSHPMLASAGFDTHQSLGSILGRVRQRTPTYFIEEGLDDSKGAQLGIFRQMLGEDHMIDQSLRSRRGDFADMAERILLGATSEIVIDAPRRATSTERRTSYSEALRDRTSHAGSPTARGGIEPRGSYTSQAGQDGYSAGRGA